MKVDLDVNTDVDVDVDVMVVVHAFVHVCPQTSLVGSRLGGLSLVPGPLYASMHVSADFWMFPDVWYV